MEHKAASAVLVFEYTDELMNVKSERNVGEDCELFQSNCMCIKSKSKPRSSAGVQVRITPHQVQMYAAEKRAIGDVSTNRPPWLERTSDKVPYHAKI